MRTPVKKFRISAQVNTGPKTAKNGYFQEGVCDRVQPKQHNFRQWESFLRLVDIPRMCFVWVLVGDVRSEHYKPTKTTNFSDRRRILLHGSMSVTRGHSLFELILQRIPRCTTPCLVCKLYSKHLRFSLTHAVSQRCHWSIAVSTMCITKSFFPDVLQKKWVCEVKWCYDDIVNWYRNCKNHSGDATVIVEIIVAQFLWLTVYF